MEYDFSVETEIPKAACYACHHILDACAGPCHPTAEDWTVCFYCGEVNVFTSDLLLRKPNPAEAKAILDHGAIQSMSLLVKRRRN